MEKDYSKILLIVSTVFSAFTILLNVLYLSRFHAFYLAGIILGSIALIACVTCLVLRLTKFNGQENIHKILMRIGMFACAVPLLMTGIGTLIIMFIM